MFGDIETNPKGYPIKQIDEFSELFAGATPSTKVSAYWENGTIPWMSSGEVHMGRVTATEKKISQLGYDKCSTKMVPIHTVVIALAGQGKTRGTVAVTEIELCTNQSLCAMVTNGTVLSDYLYYNLRNRYEEIRSMCAIADGRGGLNLKIVGSIKVIVPLIEEQRAFIDFAEQSDKSKFIRFKSQFIEMFGNITETISLDECCTIHARIGWQALKQDEHQSTGDYMLITGTDFVNGRVNYDTCVYVSKERYDMDPKIQLQNGDILITKDGTIGKVAIVEDLPMPATLNAGVFVVRPDGRFNVDFFSYLFKGPVFEEFVEVAKSGSTIKHLNQGKLKNYTIPVAQPEQQEVFATLYKQSDKSKYSRS